MSQPAALESKRVFVTGANTGNAKIGLLICDLSSLASVRAAAAFRLVATAEKAPTGSGEDLRENGQQAQRGGHRPKAQALSEGSPAHRREPLAGHAGADQKQRHHQ